MNKTNKRRSFQDGRKSRRNGSKDTNRAGDPIWGIHAVAAALANPQRQIEKLYLTQNAAGRISEILSAALPEFEDASPKDISKLVGDEPVHQGALLFAKPLAEKSIDDLFGNDCVVVLDQVTDPHNVGAILRSAAAFGISSLIMTQRNSPPLSGTLAKTASGGLESVDVILVGNLSQALAKLGALGYQRIGFDGEGEQMLEQQVPFDKSGGGQGIALVLGAEEKGMRRLTRENCDLICRIHAGGAFASLNVSNAAAIAFHHFQKQPG